jgi:hypothetical protein
MARQYPLYYYRCTAANRPPAALPHRPQPERSRMIDAEAEGRIGCSATPLVGQCEQELFLGLVDSSPENRRQNEFNNREA